MQVVLPLRVKQETNDYPYGGLRTIAFFSIEFKPRNGFRSVFQTVNPKNNRLNAEKKGTYCDFMYLIRNEENGHFETRTKSVRCFKDVNVIADFISENEKALDLSTEMVKEICASAVRAIAVSVAYTDADKDKLKETVKDALKIAQDGVKTGVCQWKSLVIDMKAIENLEIEFKKPK